MPTKLPITLTVAAFAHVAVLAIPVAERARQRDASEREPAMELMEMEFPERPTPPKPIPEIEPPPPPEPEPEPEPVQPAEHKPQRAEPEPPKPPQEPPSEPEAAEPEAPDQPDPGGGNDSPTEGDPGGVDAPQRDGGTQPRAGGPGHKRDAPPGKGTGDQKKAKADFLGYGKSLHKRVQKQQHYPRSAKSLGLEGMAKVKVKIDRKGKLVGQPTLVKSTGHEVLDDEALAMVERAAPFDTLPVTFDKDVATIVLPLSFKLRAHD